MNAPFFPSVVFLFFCDSFFDCLHEDKVGHFSLESRNNFTRCIRRYDGFYMSFFRIVVCLEKEIFIHKDNIYCSIFLFFKHFKLEIGTLTKKTLRVDYKMTLN